ncbi:MAG: sensor histidine kinase [Spirochaetaceae bacterium]|nr:sensor histidine kinase [Spirochaetaceae bacterium]
MSDAHQREELRNLAARLLTVREDERKALARELHDDLGQALTAMKLGLAWIGRRLRNIGDSAETQGLIAKSQELESLINDTITTIRRISTELRPAVLDMMGLWPALEAEAARFSARTGIECAIRPGSDSWKPCSEKVSIELFRIVQEALTNVARHAKAKSVEISCMATPLGHALSITDDGQGIGSIEIANSSSLGLIGMRERALSFNGEFFVSGASGAGSTVTVTIPANAAKGAL